jgi:hypothetical protein
MKTPKLTSNELEAANRAEATALLIRSDYRVYRPEADAYGEDLVVRTPKKELRAVQLKGRLAVDPKYRGKEIWMLFPECTYRSGKRRRWFLIPHDELFDWIEKRSGKTPYFKKHQSWSIGTLGKAHFEFLAKYEIRTADESRRGAKRSRHPVSTR